MSDLLTLTTDLSISDREFQLFRTLVHERTGIALGPHKRHLLRARLGRRLRALGFTRFSEYYEYLMDPDAGGAAEMGTFINAITTNKTDFFREPHHFEYLSGPWAQARRLAGDASGRRLRFWSAACSSGEEAYTLAIMLSEARLVPPLWDTRILASDIDTDVLAQAQRGEYPMERTAPVPRDLLRRYFLHREGPDGEEVRVRPELQQMVSTRRINLAEPTWPIRARFDVIFCRNALIYFDRATQKGILERLVGLLEPGGLLFLGHAESVFGLVEGLAHLGNTIYARASDLAARGQS